MRGIYIPRQLRPHLWTVAGLIRHSQRGRELDRVVRPPAWASRAERALRRRLVSGIVAGEKSLTAQRAGIMLHRCLLHKRQRQSHRHISNGTIRLSPPLRLGPRWMASSRAPRSRLHVPLPNHELPPIIPHNTTLTNHPAGERDYRTGKLSKRLGRGRLAVFCLSVKDRRIARRPITQSSPICTNRAIPHPLPPLRHSSRTVNYLTLR